MKTESLFGALTVGLLLSVSCLQGGMIILTGQDSDFHASFAPCPTCSNPPGAQGFLSTAIQDVRGGSTKPFLFVESSITPPVAVRNPDGSINGNYAFHVDGIKGIENSGYTPGVDFVKADASTLAQQLTQNLSNYSAIVVASDFGGILTGAELQILNQNKDAIANFLLSGGGLLALGESNDGIGPNATYDANGNLNPNQGLLGAATPYGFLPFSVTTTNTDGVSEGTNTSATAVGSGLGFTTNDFTGNYYFNTIHPQTSYSALGTDRNGDVLAVLITPEPGSIGLAAIGLLLLTGIRRSSKNRRVVPE